MTDQQTFDNQIYWYSVLGALGAGICLGLLIGLFVLK
jgi:hypothetical protein